MKSVYGRDSATRYAPGDKKDVNQLISEAYRQQRQIIPSASSSFKAGQVIPRGGYGSTGPLRDANIWGNNDLLAATLGDSLDRQEFEDGLAMTRFMNKNEIAAMQKQFQTDKDYQESLQPKPKNSAGGIIGSVIGAVIGNAVAPGVGGKIGASIGGSIGSNV
tara:strand:- start:776 stop:1261 length:486 start_codon:yes stop_codon:yes gene_type:complete